MKQIALAKSYFYFFSFAYFYGKAYLGLTARKIASVA